MPQSTASAWHPFAAVAIGFIHGYFFNSYIHPDEFFQSSEVIAGNYFNTVHFTPWEYSGSKPCRSVFFPLAMFTLSAGFIKQPTMAHSYYMVALFAIWQVVRRLRVLHAVLRKPTAFRIIICAQALWTFYPRALSNSVETYLLCFLVYFTFPKQSRTVLARAREVGIVLALGFFNRPTFAFFAAVPVLSWLHDGYRDTRPPRRLWANGVWRTVAAGCVTSILCIALDTLYFGYYNWTWQCQGAVAPSTVFSRLVYYYTGCSSSTPLTPILTPLNWMVYNMQPANLAEHGIHPRITHALVNMPLMFGPLALLFYACCLHLLVGRSFKNTVAKFIRPPSVITLHPHQSGQNRRNEPGNSWQDGEWRFVRRCAVYLLASIAVPLLALSVAPHQEARFLLPLMVPLIIAFSHNFLLSRFLANLAAVHLVFGLLFFGVLHQGGLIPGLVYQSERLHQPPFSTAPNSIVHHLIYYRTYMPPRSILGWPQKFAQWLHVHDLGGAPPNQLHSLVEKLHCAASQSSDPFHVWLMAPGSVPLSAWADKEFHSMNISVERRFGPHLSTEDLPGLWTASHCLPRDNMCRKVSHLWGPVLKFYKFSLRLTLYKIEFLFNQLCTCAASSDKFCASSKCPSAAFRNCSSI